MTGPEYEAVRHSLDMTREQLAAALGITSSTIFRRENGGLILPEAESALLRLAESREEEEDRETSYRGESI